MPVEIQNLGTSHEATSELCGIVDLAVVHCLTHEGVDPDEVDVSVVFVDDIYIAELNREFRGIEGPTDVLSFPMDDPGIPGIEPVPLGDIVISLETVEREAANPGEFINYLALLVVHGLLHLLGYDHETDEDAEVMEGIEAEVLQGVFTASLGGH